MDVNITQNYTDWLSLTQAVGIGPATCHKLLSKFKTPQAVLAADYKALKEHNLSDSSINSLFAPDLNLINKILDWLNQAGNHLITFADYDYPELLKSIDTPPLVLFAVGQRQVLGCVHFAIVGSRNPTAGGRRLAEDFAVELSNSGLTVCSGLALGIDYHSHSGALKSNSPTVAVLGNGLNSIYPARHKNMANKIVENGLLISEYPPDTKPHPGNFPRRNRIISGISTGVLVVEAAIRSGSLITANHALEQGREVFAIPGSIHNPLARGTHSLIKQGAKLVETVSDILVELSPVANIILNKPISVDYDKCGYDELEADYKLLLDNIGYDAMSVDSLVELTGLTAEVVSSMLLIMELQGMIESQHGGKYCRCT
jgi:DNA processing protein